MHLIVTDVVWSVCLLVTTMSCTKTDQPYEVIFAMWTQFYQRIHVIRRGHGPPVGRGNIEGIVRPIVKYCECYSLRCSIDVACHCQYCCSLLSVDDDEGVFCYCSCCKMCRLWHMHLALTGAIHWLWQHGVGDHRPYSANRTVVHSQTAPGTPLSTCLSTFISWWHLDYRS